MDELNSLSIDQPQTTHTAHFHEQPAVIATLVFTLLTGVTLLGTVHIPGLKLSRQVAQLSAWANIEEPVHVVPPPVEVDYLSPYLLCYVLARPWVVFFGALVALKVVILLSTVANVIALRALLRANQQDVWLSLLGFPLSFGFFFYSGVLNQLLLTPLFTGAIALVLHYACSPTNARAWGLCALLIATCSCHIVAFLACLPLTVLIYTGESSAVGSRRRLVNYWPFAAAMLGASPWIVALAGNPDDAAASLRNLWSVDPKRLLALPSILIGNGHTDAITGTAGVLSLVVIAASLGLPTWSWHRLLVYELAWLLYLVGPVQLFATASVYQTFASWIVPGAILSSSSKAAPFLGERARRALVLLMSGVWLGIWTSQLHSLSS